MLFDKLKNINGDRFVYVHDTPGAVKWDTVISVFCKKHKCDFKTTPGYQLKKRYGKIIKYVGCPDCRKEKTRLTRVNFIKRASVVHNNKYDYNKVNFNIGTDVITITCPVHGDIVTTPAAHLAGKGCKYCANEKSKMTTKQFIKLANLKHKNKYDYTHSIYNGSRKKIKITCDKHGSFKQRPDMHLQGQGCPECSRINRQKTFTEFINNAKKIHNDKYVYPEFSTDFIKSKKIEITCPVHGSFFQTPYHHTNRKQGCPKCKSSKGEELIFNFLVKNKIKFEKEYKLIDEQYAYRYDFYLPELNILIEFDGRQHYVINKHWGGKESLIKGQKRDIEKTKLAKNLGYELIRIPYFIFMDTETYLVTELTRIYKYYYNGTYYKNFIDLFRRNKKIFKEDLKEKDFNLFLLHNKLIF